VRENVLYPDAYHTGGPEAEHAESSTFQVVANPNLKKCVGTDGKYNGAYESAEKILNEMKVTKYDWRIIGVSDCILQESDKEYGSFFEVLTGVTTNYSGVKYVAGKDTVKKINIICIITLNNGDKEKVVYTGDISVFMLAVRMDAYGTTRTIMEYGNLAYDGTNRKQKLVEFTGVDAPNSKFSGVGLSNSYIIDAEIASKGSGKETDTVAKSNSNTIETWEIFGYTKGDLSNKINCSTEVKIGYYSTGTYTTIMKVLGARTGNLDVLEKIINFSNTTKSSDVAAEVLEKADVLGWTEVIFKEMFTASTGVGGIVGAIYVDYPVRANIVGGGFRETYYSMHGCDSSNSGPSGGFGFRHDLGKLKKVQVVKIEPTRKVSGCCKLLATLAYKKSGVFQDVEGSIIMDVGGDAHHTVCLTGIPAYVAK
jgi:hypothetical protein